MIGGYIKVSDVFKHICKFIFLPFIWKCNFYVSSKQPMVLDVRGDGKMGRVGEKKRKCHHEFSRGEK